MPDAIVIGSGPNGLVAANVLRDHGWDTLVLEAAAEPGGAVRSGELTEPGYIHDLFSSFYPLGIASPPLRALNLEEHGLRWRHAPLVLAHPVAGGRAVTLSRSLEETVTSLETFAVGDGDAWARLFGLWHRLHPHLVEAILEPFPPLRHAAVLAARLGIQDGAELARFMLLPVRRMGEETFRGDGGKLLLTGNALHADLPPESPPSGALGWLLASLGQHLGFPAPEGGAGELTRALVARFVSRGGAVQCNARVTRVVVEGGKAVGVETADGESVSAGRAILADTTAPSLFLDLVDPAHLPNRLVRQMENFQFDNGVVKVDWVVDGGVPWEAAEVGRAGTVHISGTLDDLTERGAQLSQGVLPRKPYLVMGQMTTTDPTRSPDGAEVAWGYSHVPRNVKGDAAGELTQVWDDAAAQRFADRMEQEVERYAPGFRARIRTRHVFAPSALQAENPNLDGGALNSGTSQIYQELIFRPAPALLGRPSTPIKNLFLASASAHPGGGVHGACGANAAHAALTAHRPRVYAAAALASAAGVAAIRRR